MDAKVGGSGNVPEEERRQKGPADEAVRESDAKLRSVADTSADAIILADTDGTIIFWGRGAERLFGYAAREAVGQPVTILIPGRYRNAHLQGIQEARSGKRLRLVNKTVELVALRKNGTEFPIELRLGTWKGNRGTFYSSAISDLTERKHTEHALWQTEAKYRTLVETAHDVILACDPKGRITFANRKGLQTLGYVEEEVIGRSLTDFVPAEHAEKERSLIRDVLAGKDCVNFEHPTLTKDGRVVVMNCNATALRDAAGNAIGLLATAQDMTERKRAEEDRWKAYRQTEQLLASLQAVLIGVDADGLITRWNAAAENALGIPARAAIGQPFFELAIPWNWQGIRECLAESEGGTRGSQLRDVSYTHPDGTTGFLGVTINPIQRGSQEPAGFLLLGADLADRKSLEAQLAQAQKLECIGQLAAGIAHEINTPTQYISDNTRFLQDAVGNIVGLIDLYHPLLAAAKSGVAPSDLVARAEAAVNDANVKYLLEEIPKAICQSLEGLERVTRIVRAMKEFSHPGGGERTPTDVNHAIQTTITVARNEWKYVAEVDTDFDPSLPSVPCFPADLNQVILNVIVNAAHAIAEVVGDGSQGKGRIGISTRRDGDWIEIRISDSGPGVPEAIRTKLFDPFFTTKEVGKGTGQGLAIAHDVITRKHRGTIHFETETGKGTTFIIRLPVGGSQVAQTEAAP